jgi:glycosyltransferase involved in cell wall biosynthesis
VDDGSDPDRRAIFDRVAEFPNVTVLRHAVNLGKGRALKTGFNFLLTALPWCAGVVTADADGQHASEDIVRVAEALPASGRRGVLGARTMQRDVPLRSRFGNTVTRSVFRFLTGRRISDTQTGLRAFPVALLPDLLSLQGERYEYEMTVLALLCRKAAAPVEVPIRTVYIDGNRSSHFDPIRDSMRIYFVLLRFYASSLIAAGIDFAGFTLAFALSKNILVSMLAGRLSSVVNYLLNRGFVFQSGASVGGSVWRYYLLAVVLAGVSYGAIRELAAGLGWNVLAAKITVETLLSLASFALQRTFVFPVREEE